MFKVTGLKNGVIWDGHNDRPLAQFKDGEFMTGDQATAKKLEAMGFAVEGAFKTPESLDEMTIKELTEFAESNGIDLGDATKKAEILDVIQAALADGEGKASAE